MAANPQKAFDWAAFDKLLVPEKPGPEWVSGVEINKRYGKVFGTGSKFQRLRELFEVKKFKGADGKWRNYYRIKQNASSKV